VLPVGNPNPNHDTWRRCVLIAARPGTRDAVIVYIHIYTV